MKWAYVAGPKSRNSFHMMFKSTFFAAASFLMVVCGLAQAPTAELLSTSTASTLAFQASAFGLDIEPQYDVQKYRVTYAMPYLEDTILVSGALFVPQGFDDPCGLPIHIYMHGTIFKRTDAPSYNGTEGVIGNFMCTVGQLVLMPDYVGLGSSSLMHPYVQAQSESDAGVHLMLAADQLSEELAYTLNGQNFVSGYSQGGHAAMALARDLTNGPFSTAFPLTAAVPQSGPYDISGTQFPMTFEFDSYSNPAYLAYNVIGWNSYYGTLYEDLNEIFQEPYATELPLLFDGETDGDVINNACPSTLDSLLVPGLIDDILTDANHPFMVAAADNDVYDWVPQVPLEMYYCTEDEQVFYQNALVANDWMTNLGSTSHNATNLGAFDHGICAGIAILQGTNWIQSQVETCATRVKESDGPSSMSLFPNPATDMVQVDGFQDLTPWGVVNQAGTLVTSGRGKQIDVAGIPSGLYILRAEGYEPTRFAVIR